MFPKLAVFLLEDLKRRKFCCTQLVPSERTSLWISQIRCLTKVKMMDLSESSLLLQSALQPLWFLAWSTIVEYSQQEGFYRVPLPAARQTPNLEDQ
jgi:hypothetical protein